MCILRTLKVGLGLAQRAAVEIARVPFAKVAQFWRRGAVHSHAIIRFDGVSLDEEFPPVPRKATEVHLSAAIRSAARLVACTSLPLRETFEGIGSSGAGEVLRETLISAA